MQHRTLATDYDGTLATQGKVDEQTLAALHRFVSASRQLLLVTGRELPELKRIFPNLNLFARVIAENGALLYSPASGEEQLLCRPIPLAFIDKLRNEGIPFSRGRAVVATVEHYKDAVRKAIETIGMDLQISLNKGSVMVLPAGVNKATGLRRALAELAIPPTSVVGIGDTENDREFLNICGCAVAVANALPSVKSSVHLVTAAAHGAGVAEIIDRMLAGDPLIRADGRNFLKPD
jgi:hydroxymethylpyrimidine pyrophosphatase-like HAD family hydrolase